MKVRLQKLSPAELLKAALEGFEVDITGDMLKAAGMDTEAAETGVATKGDSNVDARLSAIEKRLGDFIDAFPAVLDASVKAALPKVDEAQLAKIEGFNPTEFVTMVTGLKSEVTTLTEKAAQAVLTADAVKSELAQKLTAAPATGAMTPAMQALIDAQNKTGKPTGFFGNNVALKGVSQ